MSSAGSRFKAQLHFVGQLVAAGIFGGEFDLQVLFVGHQCRRAGMPPVIGRAAAEDRGQPCPAATLRPKMFATLPGGAKGLLDQVFRLMPIPHKAVCQTIHRRAMVCDHAIEIRNGKRHSDVSLVPPHPVLVARISG